MTKEQIESIALKKGIIIPENIMKKASLKIKQMKENRGKEENER